MLLLMLFTGCALLYGTSRVLTRNARVPAMARLPREQATRPGCR